MAAIFFVFFQEGGTKIDIPNCVAGSVMTIITFFGQIMVFIVVAKDPRLRTPGNYFILSLAIADFLISIISMPVWTIFASIGYWPVSQVRFVHTQGGSCRFLAKVKVNVPLPFSGSNFPSFFDGGTKCGLWISFVVVSQTREITFKTANFCLLCIFQFWCDIWNVCDYVLCCVSIYTILFISVDRYLSLKYPLKYQVSHLLSFSTNQVRQEFLCEEVTGEMKNQIEMFQKHARAMGSSE